MRKIRFLILTAVFALVGFSIVSCPGASPSGTAKVSEAAVALGAGIPLNTPFDTAALHSDIAITLANVSTVDSWNTPADAITWLKWKASADATETQDMTADTIGGVTVTATPTGEGKDCISVNIKSTAGAQKEFDGILTEIVIPADKLTSNAELAVKLGIGDNANGVPLKFVNSGTRVAGTPVVVFASGSTNAEGGRALYSIASDFSDAFVSEVNTATATGGVKVTDWFSGLNGKNIEAFAKRIATETKAATDNAPAEVAKRTIEIVFKSGATALTPTDRLIKSDLVIENPSTGTKYLPDGVGKVTIADAVKTYVRKPADGPDGVKATVAITKPADAKTIEGATRTALDAELTITIDGDCVEYDIKKDNEDVAAGLAQLIALPLGVKASLKDDISAGDTSFAIALTGKPSDITEANVEAAHNRWAATPAAARDLLIAAIDGYLPGANPWEPGTEDYERYLPLLSGTYEAEHPEDFFKGLLHVSNPEGDNQLKWAIAETPYAVISDVDEDSPKAMRGIVGQQLPGNDDAREVSITLNCGHFKAIAGSTDLIGWFGTEGQDFPTSAAGDNKIKAVTTSNKPEGATNINVRISGIPTAEFAKKLMKIKIPADSWYTEKSGDTYVNTIGALVVDTNDFAYWEAKAAYATVSNATINGKINTAIANQTVTLTLTNAKFVAFTNDNKTVTPWFKNLPADLVATATTQDAAQSVVVTISGTPRTVSNAPLEIKIPANMMTNLAETPAALESDVTVDANANCKFAISPRATVSTATISGTQNVALEDQTVTITLDGAKFKAFTDGEQGTRNVKTWFTNLPTGLSATAAVQAAGSSSVVVTISGTPADPSNAQLAITIPANMMTDLAQEPAALTSPITVDVNNDCKFSIAAAN